MKPTTSITLSRGTEGKFGIDWNKSEIFGKVITDVTPGSSTSKIGEVEIGDEIISINETPVSSTDDISRLMRKAGQNMTLSLRKKGKVISNTIII